MRRIDRGAGTFAASHAQARLWRDYQKRLSNGGTQAIYHSLVPIRFHCELDVLALMRAIETVMGRHEILHSCLLMRNGELVQRPMPIPHMLLTARSMARDADDTAESALAREMSAFVAQDFDLAEQLPLRADLLRVGDREHILLLIVHHVASDGWSHDVLFSELLAFYKAYAQGVTTTLPPIPIQYADYVGWEAERLEKGACADALEYWMRQLEDVPRDLALPTDRPPSPHMTWRGARHTTQLPNDLIEAVSRLASDLNTFTFQVWMATTQLLLARWTGQYDVVIGTPLANRSLPETEPLIAPFANLIAFRLRIEEADSFADLVLKVQDQFLDSLEYQNVDFELLCERLSSKAGPSFSSLARAILIESKQPEPIEIGGTDAWAEAVPYLYDDSVHAELTFNVRKGACGSELDIFYATELFDSNTIERLAQRFITLLRSGISDPSGPIARINGLSPSELYSLAGFERGAPAAPWRPLSHRFAEIARRFPDRIALAFDDQTVSYARLWRSVQSIGQTVATHRGTRERLIGLCLPRNADRIAAILGVLYAGCAFLPIDPTLPDERLEYLLRDSGVDILIGDTTTLHRFNRHTLQLIDVAKALEAAADCVADAPYHVHPDALAYVIYTSGSTGEPKGVEITQRGIAAFVSWYIETFDLCEHDRCLQLASINFDASLLDSLPALMCGASLWIGADSWRQDPDGLWDRLSAAGVTVAFLTSPLFNAAVTFDGEWPSSMPRCVQVGGDQLMLPTRALPFALYNLYGPTEATIAATCGHIADASGIHIGAPISGATVRVLDSRLRRVPIASVGELFISGPGLARGYRGRPGLTASNLVADPFDAGSGRMYRTGDRVRWMCNGQLEYLGRQDDQIKVLGHRIEPSEIETALMNDPAVAEVVVTTHARNDRTRELIAYVRLAAGGTLDEVRMRLSTRLPAWMLPRLVEIARFPLTVNGKIDRHALPDTAQKTDKAYIAPEGPVAELVASLWNELLGVDRPSADDDFFMLGGYSLLVGRLQSRIAMRTGIEVPFRLVFDHPVLSDFASALEDLLLASLQQD
jgi:amino acid adenylation domain-containing protein